MADIDYEEQERKEVVTSIRNIAKVQGQRVTSREIASSINAIAKTVVQRVNQMSLETTKGFLPIQSQLRDVQQLLQSSRTDDQERAFELIDRMQERLGVDLSKYSKDIGDAVKKLYDMNQQRKEDKAQAQQIHTQKVEELKQEREILRERGINTYINEENYKLELRTKEQEKQERLEIISKEKELKQRERQLSIEAKDIQRAETIDLDRQERFLAEQENLTKDQLELQDRKEAAGMGPNERAQGFLSQTFGAAFGEMKNFGMELKQIGKSVKDTFADIPDLIGNFAKGVGTLITRFKLIAVAMIPAILGFLALAAPFIAIAVAIGLLLYNLDKIINWFKNSALGRLLGLDDGAKEREEKDKQEGTGKYQSLDEGTYDVMDGQDTGNMSTRSPKDPIAPFYDKNSGQIIQPDNPNYDEIRRKAFPDLYKIQPMSGKTGTLDEMKKNQGDISPDKIGPLPTEDYAKAPTNNVIAPNNNVITTNTTNQSMGIIPQNIDNTFLNLNKVLV